MKNVWYISPYGFAAEHPRGTWGSGGVSDRVGFMTELRKQADVKLVGHVPMHSRAWVRDSGLEWITMKDASDPAWHYPPTLIVEQFLPSYWFRERLLQFYRILEQFRGTVVYLHFDPDWYFPLDAQRLSKICGGEIDQKKLWQGKRYVLATAARKLSVCEGRWRAKVKPWAFPPDYEFRSFNLSAVTLNAQTIQEPLDSVTPKRVVVYGQETTQRRKFVQTLKDASPDWRWRLFGRWKSFSLQPITVPQTELPALLRREAGVVVNLYRKDQDELGWQPNRDFEAICAGVPVLVPSGSPPTQRPGWNHNWEFSSPPEFKLRLQYLNQPNSRADVARAQQVWRSKFSGAQTMRNLLRTLS